jgi:hypothetical protein
VQRAINEFYLVPGVLNYETKGYTDGSEKGMPRGLAKGDPGDPFVYDDPTWASTPTPEALLSGYPSLRDRGDLSDYGPSNPVTYCLGNQTPFIQSKFNDCIGTPPAQFCIEKTRWRCPNNQKIYLWWQPAERAFK